MGYFDIDEQGILKEFVPEMGEVEAIIPENVTAIGKNAFEDCIYLESIIIPQGVECINTKAFKNCRSLKRIVLPESVGEIRRGAFDGCRSLTDIVFPEGFMQINYSLVKDTLLYRNCTDDFMIINDVLIKYKGKEKEVTIPEGVKKNRRSYILRSHRN